MAATLPLDGDGNIDINTGTRVDGKIKLTNAASGAGKNLTIEGSNAVSGDTDGGNILLMPGDESGSGKKGRVGIGTTTVPAKLTVVGGAPDGNNGIGQFLNTGIASWGDVSFLAVGKEMAAKRAALFGYRYDTNEDNAGAFITMFANDWGQGVFVKEGGNVGLGLIGPASKLSVAGNAAIGATYAWTPPAPENGLIVEGKLGIGTTSPANKLSVNGSVDISGDVDISGKVGLGTASPDHKLSVSDTSSGKVTYAIFGQDKTSDQSEICVGEQASYDKSLVVGYDHAEKYGSIHLAGVAYGKSLVLQNGGNVGIGAKNKLSKLTVIGRANFDATGSVFKTATENTLTGEDTRFLSEVGIGDRIKVWHGAQYEERTVTSIESDTSLTVDSAWAYTASRETASLLPCTFRVEDDEDTIQLIIKHNGMVGINDISPDETLDVNGNINSTGRIKIDGTAVLNNQQAHIADADGTLADITSKFNTLLSKLESHGLLAAS